MRRPLPLILALAVLLLSAVPVAAGGWATVTLDKVPTELRAGSTHTLGYTILQHGVTPFTGSKSVIRARSASGREVLFHARPDGAPGHYAVDVNFPAAGSWTWEVVPEPFAPQPLGTITVTGVAAPAAEGAASVATRTDLATVVLRAALVVATLCAGLSFVLTAHQARRAITAVR